MKRLSIYNAIRDDQFLDHLTSVSYEHSLLMRTESFPSDEFNLLDAKIHFYRMRKDLLDTFKPYKHSEQVVRDYLQFFHGMMNFCTGVLMWLMIPLIAVYGLTAGVYDQIRNPTQPILADMTKALFVSIVNSISSTIRGLTQVISAPLMLIRMPFRALLTWLIKPKKIEENTGIKNLVAKAYDPMTPKKDQKFILLALKHKCIKARLSGQHSEIPEIENSKKAIVLYADVDLPLSIFKNPHLKKADDFSEQTLGMILNPSVNML